MTREPYDFVFVVCMARSGGTIVTGMMNCLPGTLIRGENAEFVLPLLQAQANIAFVRSTHGSRTYADEQTSPFWGAGRLAPDRSASALRYLTRDMLGAWHRTIGGKFVDWTHVWLDDIPGMVKAAESIFGNVGWLLHDRQYVDIMQSGWWTEEGWRDKASETYLHVLHVQDRIADTTPHVLHSTYEDLNADTGAWCDRLAGWMGHELDDGIIAAMQRTKTASHSFRNRQEAFTWT